MQISFSELTGDAKVYIYPSSKKLHPELLEQVTKEIDAFIIDWTATHNITTAVEIKYQRFVIFGIENDTPLTTLIIDELVTFILKLQTQFELELLDKVNVCFKQGEHVQYKEVKEFKKIIKNRGVNENTIVFDNLVNTKDELDHDWELPASETWHSRMF